MDDLKILALDPATSCGWAHSDGESGTWDLSTPKDSAPEYRLFLLQNKLDDIANRLGIHFIAYEAPRHANPKMAASNQFLARLQAAIWMWCGGQSPVVGHRGYSPSEIKKHATGKGNANKDAMMIAAENKFGQMIDDDNQADALWLLDLARQTLPIKNYG